MSRLAGALRRAHACGGASSLPRPWLPGASPAQPRHFSEAVTNITRRSYSSNVQSKTHYDILGIPRHASQKEIKSAYYELAKRHHPDVNKNDSLSAKEFAAVSEAYEILGDKDKRLHYDAAHTITASEVDSAYGGVTGLGTDPGTFYHKSNTNPHWRRDESSDNPEPAECAGDQRDVKSGWSDGGNTYTAAPDTDPFEDLKEGKQPEEGKSPEEGQETASADETSKTGIDVNASGREPWKPEKSMLQLISEKLKKVLYDKPMEDLRGPFPFAARVKIMANIIIIAFLINWMKNFIFLMFS